MEKETFFFKGKEFDKTKLFKEFTYWIDLILSNMKCNEEISYLELCNFIRIAMKNKWSLPYWLVFQQELYELFLDYITENIFFVLKDIDSKDHEFIFVKKW